MNAPGGDDLDTGTLLNLRHLAARMPEPKNLPRTGLPGGIVHRRRGRGLEVHDIRAWSEGDDPRHLDRNVTARTGVPHVKTFRDERERSTLLVADFRSAMLFGTRRVFRSVAAGEALALLGWRAVAEGGRVGLVAVTPAGTHYARAGRGARAMIGLVGDMVLAHRAALAAPPAKEATLAEVLEEAGALAGNGAHIIVATALDHRGDGLEAVAERMARQHDLHFVLATDAFELEAPAGSYPYVTARGTAGWMRVGRAGGPAEDARPALLRRLGAQVSVLDTRLAAEAMARALERADG